MTPSLLLPGPGAHPMGCCIPPEIDYTPERTCLAGLPQHLTLDYLRALLSRGVEKAAVTEEARTVLRKWVMDARRIARGKSLSVPLFPEKLQPPPEIPGQPPDSVDEVSSATNSDILSRVASGRTEEAALPRHISFALEGETEEEKLSSLRELVVNWPPLRNMESLRDTPVFSSGSPRADIMMVTDAPGLYEEKQGIPLAGPSGQKLDAMLKAMGLSRTDIYLTHLVRSTAPPSPPAYQQPATHGPGDRGVPPHSPGGNHAGAPESGGSLSAIAASILQSERRRFPP